ncbi:hypothetical protein L5515_006263 [Caenorhabditis briggsae]|uniref:Uncharacterized protein n=1 Tax=Caenorhabditis briggsae TaxID=6238 RepID=A0AAE9JHY2_CAEBR|nr:hypothetical protein L5515_006263 [Caenorhabditis briggsae]
MNLHYRSLPSLYSSNLLFFWTESTHKTFRVACDDAVVLGSSESSEVPTERQKKTRAPRRQQSRNTGGIEFLQEQPTGRTAEWFSLGHLQGLDFLENLLIHETFFLVRAKGSSKGRDQI